MAPVISAADRLRGFIERRKPALRDKPPTLPGYEWRRDDDGGWNLWLILEDDGQGKRRSRYAGWLPPEEWDAIKKQVEAKDGDQASVGGGNLDRSNMAGGQAADVAHTSGQIEERTDRPPVSSQPQKSKARRKKNVIPFQLPTSGQGKGKTVKQKTSPSLPTGEQTDAALLKSVLPTSERGYWWETPADDKGYRIKLRWRGGQPPRCYVFRRLGKYEFQTLKEKTYERQCWLIADRLRGELLANGRADLAARIRPNARHHRVAGAEN